MKNKILFFLLFFSTSFFLYSQGFDYDQLDTIEKEIDKKKKDIIFKLDIGGAIENQFHGVIFPTSTSFYDYYPALEKEYPYKQIMDYMKANIFFKLNFSNVVSGFIDLGMKANISDVKNNSFYNLFSLREGYLSLNIKKVVYFDLGFIRENWSGVCEDSITDMEFIKAIHQEYYDEEVGIPLFKLTIQPINFLTIMGILYFDKVINYKDLTSAASIQFSKFNFNAALNYFFLRDFVNKFSDDDELKNKQNYTHYATLSLDYRIKGLELFYEGGLLFNKSKYYIEELPGNIVTNSFLINHVHRAGLSYNFKKIHLIIGSSYMYNSHAYSKNEFLYNLDNLADLKERYYELESDENVSSSIKDEIKDNYFDGISLFHYYNNVRHMIIGKVIGYDIANSKTDLGVIFRADVLNNNYLIETFVTTKYIKNIEMSLKAVISTGQSLNFLSFKYIPVHVQFSLKAHF